MTTKEDFAALVEKHEILRKVLTEGPLPPLPTDPAARRLAEILVCNFRPHHPRKPKLTVVRTPPDDEPDTAPPEPPSAA
jgi:hypothetical protein